MTTTHEAPRREHFVLRGVSWRFYESLLKEIGNQHIYVTYDRGTLELMASSLYHERHKRMIGRLIGVLTLELNIPIVSGGSTTFRREDLDRGLEPDECYYIQHERQVREKLSIDLSCDPPPDLAIEIDYTPRAIDRAAVYAALGVPEVWQFNLRRLQVLAHQPDGSYQPAEKSLAFPFLPMREFEQFVKRYPQTSETPLAREFQQWVIRNLHG